MSPSSSDKIIFFDGVCNLCNGFVQFIIKRDRSAKFRFASLQSEYARARLTQAHRDPGELYSIIFMDGTNLLERSDAVLEIARHLGGPWSLLTSFKILPRRLRDALYNFVAGNRYRWFGRQDQCMIPTPELKARFVE
jgi:predicted DCC family thiol-disulfide oxidoreductase YuxK